jgi:hypothetical protein
MAELPNPYGRRPTARFGQTPFEATPVVKDAGVEEGRAESALFGAVSQLGVNFGRYLEREQFRTDKTALEDKEEKLLNLGNRLAEEFSQTEGGNALKKEFMPGTLEKYQQEVDALMEGFEVSDPLVKEEIPKRLENAKANFNLRLIKHVNDQKSAYEESVYKGNIVAHKDNAASNWGNLPEVQRSRDETERYSRTWAALRGYSEEATEALVKDNLSDLHIGVIQNAIDAGDIEYAKFYYEGKGSSVMSLDAKTGKKTKGFKHEILGGEHDNVEDMLRTAGIRAASQRAVDFYITEGIGEKEALARAGDEFKGSPDLRKAVEQRITLQYGQNDRLLKEAQKSAADAGWGIIEESRRDPDVTITQALDSIPNSLWDQMDPKAALSLRDYATKVAAEGKVVTDDAEYYRLRRLYASEPEKFMDPLQTNLLESRSKLNDADWQEMVKLQTPKGAEEKRIDAFASTRQEIVDKAIRQVGMEPKDDVEQNDKGEAVRAFQRRVDIEFDAWAGVHKAKPMGKDMQEIVDRLAIEIIRKRSGVDAWMADQLPFMDKYEVIGYAGTTDVPGVPTYLVDEMAKLVKEDYLPVTIQNIQAKYKELFGK